MTDDTLLLRQVNPAWIQAGRITSQIFRPTPTDQDEGQATDASGRGARLAIPSKMTRDQAKHRRRSIRLQGYDYSQPGAYFVTICTQNYSYLFGDIVEGEMVLNEAGQMVQGVWDELPMHYPGIETDAFIIMPNHVHGIIVIQPSDVGPASSTVGAGPCACPGDAPQSSDMGHLRVGHSRRGHPHPRHPHPGQPQGVAPTTRMSLPDVVHRFKTLTTKRYTDAVKHNGWKPFPGRSMAAQLLGTHCPQRTGDCTASVNISSITRQNGNPIVYTASPSKLSPVVQEGASKYAEEEWDGMNPLSPAPRAAIPVLAPRAAIPV